ncbi:MAG: protein kinase, partial [Verrucomicrobiota bacterium]
MSSERARKIDEVLQSALELAPEQRPAFLKQACANDDALHREVESLIVSYERAGSFMEKPAVEVDASLLAGAPAASIVGQSLGHYQIIRLLGAGGMGEVYCARDSRLGRDVAVKVLHVAFSPDADRLRRFEQEARATSALNHPNILTIYDVGMHNGSPYSVSELLEGETLRERLNGAALTQRKAIDYSIQVAHGLSAAHEKGIVHRDLKPENLFITNDDRVKILDFGLAKLVESAGEVAKTGVPTRKLNTERGIVMGTVGYMSPEQVRGDIIDPRSDIFSFGTVLYEMLTGQRAFRGESVVETLNAILKVEPEFTRSNRNLAPALERVVLRCLEKRPERRFQSTNDLSFTLETLTAPSGANSTSPVQALDSTPVVMRRTSRELFGWIVAALLLATAALGVAYFRRAPVEVRAVRSFILPPDKSNFSFIDTNAGSLSISPDGRRLTFVALTAEGKSLLWVRALDALSAQPLNGTEGAFFPFWSPDSRFIGFFADGKLRKIEAAGGPALPLCDAREGRGGTWNSEGMIIFAPDSSGALYQISALGGASSLATQLEDARNGAITHRWPWFLPDGQHFLYVSKGATVSEAETGTVYVTSVGSKESKLLLRANSNVAYAEGNVLFLREDRLMAQAFDIKRLEMVGEAFPMTEQVQSEPSMARGAFAVSENGVLAYQTGSAKNGSQLAWFDRKGKQLSVLGDQAIYHTPYQLSPDGKKVALDIVDPLTGNQDIWLYEV